MYSITQVCSKFESITALWSTLFVDQDEWIKKMHDQSINKQKSLTAFSISDLNWSYILVFSCLSKCSRDWTQGSVFWPMPEKCFRSSYLWLCWQPNQTTMELSKPWPWQSWHGTLWSFGTVPNELFIQAILYRKKKKKKRARLADAALITPLKIILIKVNIHTHIHSHGQRKQRNRYLLRLFRDPVFFFPLSPFCQLTDEAKIILCMRIVACTNCLRKDSSLGESYICAIDRISIRRRM